MSLPTATLIAAAVFSTLDAVPATGTVASPDTSTHVAVNDPRGDVRRIKNVNTKVPPRVLRSIDMRHVEIGQVDGRNARCSVRMRQRLAANGRWAQTVQFLMRPVDERNHPYVVVTLTQNKRVKSWAQASFSDGSHADCDLTVERASTPGVLSAIVPARCTWWFAKNFDVSTYIQRVPKDYDGTDYLYAVGTDRRAGVNLDPVLAWSYQFDPDSD